MTSRTAAALLACLALGASSARADVAPPGWRPGARAAREAEVQEGSPVIAFRDRLAPALTSPEREAWMPPVAACSPESIRAGGALGYGTGSRARCRFTREQILDRVIDRGLRWLAPQALAASGDEGRAARLVGLGPMSRDADRARARALLATDAPVDAHARRLLEARSLEEAGVRLADLVVAALDAGAPRERLLSSLHSFMVLLTDPARIRASFHVEIAQATDHDAERYRVHRRLRAAAPCLAAAFEDTGWVSRVTVGVLAQSGGLTASVQGGDDALNECVRRAVVNAAERLPAPGTQALATLTHGPRVDVLFVPPLAAGPARPRD